MLLKKQLNQYFESKFNIHFSSNFRNHIFNSNEITKSEKHQTYVCQQTLTSKQIGHFLEPVSLSCPQSCNPCTWPQFRYTYGCCWFSLGETRLGITNVFNPTGHCGLPALISSISRSRSLLLWNRKILFRFICKLVC